MWIVSDNLLRGAALNAVEIAETLIKNNFLWKINHPLSPHIQIYKWHISSLVSISHRITGIINILAITFICIWSCITSFGESNYEIIKLFLKLYLENLF